MCIIGIVIFIMSIFIMNNADNKNIYIAGIILMLVGIIFVILGLTNIDRMRMKQIRNKAIIKKIIKKRYGKLNPSITLSDNFLIDADNKFFIDNKRLISFDNIRRITIMEEEKPDKDDLKKWKKEKYFNVDNLCTVKTGRTIVYIEYMSKNDKKVTRVFKYNENDIIIEKIKNLKGIIGEKIYM